MKFIPNSVSTKAALALLKTQKHSPKIMFIAGVTGTVATAVLASRATLKGVKIIEEHKLLVKDLEDISSPEYSKNDLAKDKVLLLAQTSGKLAKIYAPAFGVGVVSIGLLTGSHVVLTRRNAAATAAYAAIDKAFREYRGRVAEKIGEDQEREVYRDVREEKFTVTEPDGKQKQVVKKVAHGGSPYKVLYGRLTREGHVNPNWNSLPELNVMFLRHVEIMLNQQLQSRGYVFLNEALLELGLQRTKEGQAVGWVKDSKTGDGYIDFGIFDPKHNDTLFDFSTGREDEIWLDFNVDGSILDQI